MIKFLNKYCVKIYLTIAIIAFLFFIVMVGATGHGFQFKSMNLMVFVFLGILIVSNFRNKYIEKSKLNMYYWILSLLISIGTFIAAILILKNNLTYSYGDHVGIISKGLMSFIPLVFTLVNGIIIKQLFERIRRIN